LSMLREKKSNGTNMMCSAGTRKKDIRHASLILLINKTV